MIRRADSRRANLEPAAAKELGGSDSARWRTSQRANSSRQQAAVGRSKAEAGRRRGAQAARLAGIRLLQALNGDGLKRADRLGERDGYERAERGVLLLLPFALCLLPFACFCQFCFQWESFAQS